LIAGFASTLFWPLTTAMHLVLSWREVYVVFAAMNLVICLPIHAWIARLTSRLPDAMSSIPAATSELWEQPIAFEPKDHTAVFLLMLTGFAVEGFVLSSILVHMVPLTTTLGMGTGLLVAGLFGPSQVASRFINMLFGGRLPQIWLAIIAASLLPVALAILLTTTPWIAGAVLFAVLFGLGSGLTSIVGGTLPLELFGRAGYGAQLGWVTGARQLSSALAPFALSMAMAGTGVAVSLLTTAAFGGIGILGFSGIVLVKRRCRLAVMPEQVESRSDRRFAGPVATPPRP
jgi:hypothetical protein